MPASLYWCLEPYQVNKIPTASTSLSESDFMKLEALEQGQPAIKIQGLFIFSLSPTKITFQTRLIPLGITRHMVANWDIY